MRCISHGEVEIFREAIGLEVALLEAGAALEYPGIAKCGLGRDAGEQPAEDVVLFDDMDLELELACELANLVASDHLLVRFPVPAGVHSRHAVAKRPEAIAGSSFA